MQTEVTVCVKYTEFQKKYTEFQRLCMKKDVKFLKFNIVLHVEKIIFWLYWVK